MRTGNLFPPSAHANEMKIRRMSSTSPGSVNIIGFSALFKGMGAPLASAALVNAITFAAYAHSQRASGRKGVQVYRLFIGGRERIKWRIATDSVGVG